MAVRFEVAAVPRPTSGEEERGAIGGATPMGWFWADTGRSGSTLYGIEADGSSHMRRSERPFASLDATISVPWTRNAAVRRR